ncbi:MAG: hypothetical protein ACK42Y_05000 [Candidatus Thermochlorobacter sp.]
MNDARLIHGLLGSLTLLLGIAVALKFAIAWIGKSTYTRFAHWLLSMFGWVLLLQGLSGAVYLAYFFSQGVELGLSSWVHLGVAALAITLVQSYRAWQNRSDAEKHRNTFFTSMATIGLLIFCIALLGKS